MDQQQPKGTARVAKEVIAVASMIAMAAMLLLAQHWGVPLHNVALVFLTIVVFGALTLSGWVTTLLMGLGIVASLAMYFTAGVMVQGWDSVARVIVVLLSFPLVTIGVLLLRQRLVSALETPVRAERELFQTIMASMHDAILETDWKGIREVNASFCRMTGFSREELVGSFPPYPFWPIEDYAAVASAMESSMRGKGSDFELMMQRKGGEKFPVLVSISRIVDGNQTERRIVFSFRDITELKQKKSELAENERILKQAIEAAGLGVYDYNMRTDRLKWSGYHEKMWEYQPGEFSGSLEDFKRRVHPEDFVRVMAEVERCAQDQSPFLAEYRIIRRNGTIRWMRSHGAIFTDSAGAPERVVGVVQDITDSRTASMN